jgi:hypothetical protein
MVEKIACDLCPAVIPIDGDFVNRLNAHTIWHAHARLHKRNTTQGIVQWSKVNDEK